jgi:adenylate cyclase
VANAARVPGASGGFGAPRGMRSAAGGAVFGILQPEPDDARCAILCAREIIRLVARWNAKRRFDPPVRVGIGLHTGEAFCGVLGAQERLEFTVLGDVVNVAARMEQMTKRFGTSLVATEATVVRAGETGEWQEVGREAPRGRSGTVRMLVPSDLVLASRQAGPHEQSSGANNGGAYG